MWKGNMMTAGRRPSRTNRMPGEGRKREISGQLHILCNSGIGLGGCRIIRIMHAWLANTVVRRGGKQKQQKKILLLLSGATIFLFLLHVFRRAMTSHFFLPVVLIKSVIRDATITNLSSCLFLIRRCKPDHAGLLHDSRACC